MTPYEIDEALGALPAAPTCRCGAPTGSVALSECEGCERAREAVEYVHALAIDSHARARLDALEGGAL